jgi:UDP-glucose 4-epimerase
MERRVARAALFPSRRVRPKTERTSHPPFDGYAAGHERPTMTKKILVFGAAGFIGAYLIDELLRLHYDVDASDIDQFGEQHCRAHGVPYFHVDITKQEEFRRLPQEEFDAVIHLAALQPATYDVARYTPRDYMNVNVAGTLNILDYCARNKARKLIYASSHRNTSGLWSRGRLISEADGRAQEYVGEYAMFGISESAAQDCVEFYRAKYGMEGIIFRLPPVYGFGPHLEIFKNGEPMKTGFQTLIENAMACRPLEVWGDGTIGRDIVYVKDVVSAFVKAICLETKGGLFNITSGYRLTLREEIETIAKVFWGDGTSPQIVDMPHKVHGMRSFAYDNSKARVELDWRPEYDFESMLIDYKREVSSDHFGFLLEKRRQMFRETP